MKTAVLTALLLTFLHLAGCTTMSDPASTVRGPAQGHAAQAADDPATEAKVRIVPSQDPTSGTFLVVNLRAETVGMVPPLKFRWYLGNGREWDGPEPPKQTYITGRYDVILNVIDGKGRVRSASMKVDAENHGCSGS